MYRSSKFLLLIMIPMMIFMGYALTGLAPRKGAPGSFEVFLVILFGIMTFSFTTVTTQTGFLQMLKLGDLQKPLPFTAGRVVFFEVVSKCLPVLFAVLCGSIAVAVGDVSSWPTALACLLLSSGFCLLVSAGYALMFLMLPGHDDPLQRGFRGLMSMLGIVVVSAPSIAIAALCIGVFKTNVLVAAIPATLVNLLLAMIVTAIAGKFYASFNPAD